MYSKLYNIISSQAPVVLAAFMLGLMMIPTDAKSQCDSIEASICEEAIEITLLNFCGRTSNNIVGSNGHGFCGVNTAIHNPDYFKFTALSDTVTIEISVLPCYTGVGLQAAIFDTCAWGSSPWDIMENVLTCDPGTPPGGIMHLRSDQMIIGKTYYLLIDGSSGAECSYVITGTTGLFMPYEHEVNLQQAGDTIQAISGENFGYVWFSCEENLPLGTESFFVPPSDGCYCVEVFDGENSSVFCTTSMTTSTTDPEKKTPVTFYPNPSSDVVEINIPDHGHAALTLYIYDSMGRLTDLENISAGHHQYYWQSNQQEGVYLMMVVSDKKTIGYQRVMHRK